MDARGPFSRLFGGSNGASLLDRIGLEAKWQAMFFLAIGFAGAFVCVVALEKFSAKGWMALVLVLTFIFAVPTLMLFLALWSQTFQRVVALLRKLTWWHWLWFVIFVSGLILRKRTVAEIEQNPLDTAAVFRVSLVTFTGVLLLARLFLRYTDWVKSFFRGIVGALAIYAIICVASTIWSVYWDWTLYKSCEYGVDIALLAAILATVETPAIFKSFLNWTWLLYGLLLMACWAGVLYDPSVALSPNLGSQDLTLLSVRLVGVFPDVPANTVGELGAVLGVVAIARLIPKSREKRDHTIYAFIFLASLVTMVLAQTRSAIAGFLFGLGLVVLFSGRAIKGALFFLGVGLLTAITGLGAIVWTYLQRGESSQELSSLSSRLVWWSYAWQMLKKVPLTGLGAYAAGRFAVLAQHGYQSTATLHSDFLETLIGTSFWGILPIVAAVGLGWWSLLRALHSESASLFEQDLALEAIGVLGVLSVRMIFSDNLTLHPPLLFLVVLGFAEFMRRKLSDSQVPLPP